MAPKNFRQTTLPRFDPNEVDAVTAEPLNPHRCIRVTGPDGKFEMFYNTSTLLRIAMTRRCWMQPPHFREPMSQSLLEQVMLLEGYTEDPVAAAVRADEEEEAARRRQLAAALATDGAAAAARTRRTAEEEIDTMAAAALQRRVQHAEGFDRLMDSFVTLNRHEVYVCPVCYSCALHRICVGEREIAPPAAGGAAAVARSTPARSQRQVPSQQSATPARQVRHSHAPEADRSAPRTAVRGTSALVDDDDDVLRPIVARASTTAAAATPNRSALVDDDDDVDAARPAAAAASPQVGAGVTERRPRYVRPFGALPLISEHEFRELMRAGGSMPEANVLLRMGIDPIDVIRSLDADLELPHVVFYDANLWKQHLRRHHGELDEDDGARSDHSLRAKINEYVSALNHEQMRQRNFYRVQDTTREFWNDDARYNVSRYNSIVRELQALTARPHGKREVVERLVFAAVAPDWGQGTDAAGHKLTEKEESEFFVDDESSEGESDASAVTRSRAKKAQKTKGKPPKNRDESSQDRSRRRHREEEADEADDGAASQASETVSERKARRRAAKRDAWKAEMAERAKEEREEMRRIASSIGYRARTSDDDDDGSESEGAEESEEGEEEEEELAWSSGEDDNDAAATMEASPLEDEETTILLGNASPEPPISTGPQLSLYDDDDDNAAAVIAARATLRAPAPSAAVAPSPGAASRVTQLVDSPTGSPIGTTKSHVFPSLRIRGDVAAAAVPSQLVQSSRASALPLPSSHSAAVPHFLVGTPSSLPIAPAADAANSRQGSSIESRSTTDTSSSDSSSSSDSDTSSDSSSNGDSDKSSGDSVSSASEGHNDDEDDVLVTALRSTMSQNAGASRAHQHHRPPSDPERPSRRRHQVQTTMGAFLPRARSGAERIALSAEASERLLQAEEQRAAAAASAASASNRGLASRSIGGWMTPGGANSNPYATSYAPMAQPNPPATASRVPTRGPISGLSPLGGGAAAALTASAAAGRVFHLPVTPTTATRAFAGSTVTGERSPMALAAALRTAAHTAAAAPTIVLASPPKEDILEERARNMWGAATAAWGAVRSHPGGAAPSGARVAPTVPPRSAPVAPTVRPTGTAAQPVRIAAGTQNLIAAVYAGSQHVAGPHVQSVAASSPQPPSAISAASADGSASSTSLLRPILGRKFPLAPGPTAVTAAPLPSTNRLVEAVLVSSPRGSASSVEAHSPRPSLNEAMLAQHDRQWSPRASGASVPAAGRALATAPEGAFVGGGDAATKRLALPARRERSASPVDSVESDVSVASFARDRLTDYERALLDRADKRLGRG